MSTRHAERLQKMLTSSKGKVVIGGSSTTCCIIHAQCTLKGQFIFSNKGRCLEYRAELWSKFPFPGDKVEKVSINDCDSKYDIYIISRTWPIYNSMNDFHFGKDNMILITAAILDAFNAIFFTTQQGLYSAWYRVLIKYRVFSLKCCDFSELCQFYCSTGVLPAWYVYTH